MTPFLLIPAAIVTAFSLWASHKLHKSNRELLQLNAALSRQLVNTRRIRTAKQLATSQVFTAIERRQYGQG